MLETSIPSTMKRLIFHQVSFILNVANSIDILIPNRTITKKYFLDKLYGLVRLSLLPFRTILRNNNINDSFLCNANVLSYSRLQSTNINTLETYKKIITHNNSLLIANMKFLNASDYKEALQTPNLQPPQNLHLDIPFSSINSAFYGRNKLSQDLKSFWNDANYGIGIRNLNIISAHPFTMKISKGES